jgi:2-methylaconitate cis-trans-isomerase PrpF
MHKHSIPAVWMRGGTSKGLFFNRKDLPEDNALRDKLLLDVIGSPDPYAKQMDGLGGATSSTSKVVIISESERPDCDVNYCFGHVSITSPVIDYSGNCGNLSSAVGVYAIERGFVKNVTSPVTQVRVWQENLGQVLLVHVCVDDRGNVITSGNTQIAGVTGSGAAVIIDFMIPGRGENGCVLATDKTRETLEVADYGDFKVSLVYAGNATVFLNASSLGLTGTELPAEIDQDQPLLDKVEAIRCQAAVQMGLAESIAEASARPSTPKLAFVSKAQTYLDTQQAKVLDNEIDLCARIFSMGKLHHAFTGTGAIATAVAANIPGTIVADCLQNQMKENQVLRIGHSAGTLETSASVSQIDGQWIAEKASLTRTARTLMQGEVFLTE